MAEDQTQITVLKLRPLYRRLIGLASLMLVLMGVSAPGLVLWQAFTGQLSRFSLMVMVAGFPYLMLCMFASHLVARFNKLNQLEIDAQGLRWRNHFFRLEADYANLAGFQDGLIGLTTRTPVRLQGIGPFSLLPKSLSGIPTGLFGDPRSGEMEAALRTHAPELYETETRPLLES